MGSVNNTINGVAGMMAGGVLLFFGLDLHFFHAIPKYPMEPNHPVWLFMSVLGAVMVILSIRHMVKAPALMRQEDEFDPSGFSDPIAKQPEWTPMEGGASFCTHRLVKVGEDRIEFRPTREGRTFSLVFVLIGGVLFFALSMGLVTGTMDGTVTPAVLAVLGCVFTGCGVYGQYLSLTMIVFDRTLGLFWKGRGSMRSAVSGKNVRNLSDIHALQLLSLHHPSRSGRRGGRGMKSYFSHELILVLKDASRVSVVHHGGRQELIQDATILSQSLGLPLWNGLSDQITDA